jgi:hypothetical protein
VRVKELYYYVEIPTHYFLFGNPRVDWEFADASVMAYEKGDT